MSYSQGIERDPISVRIPSPESTDSQPLLNGDGFANLSRKGICTLLRYDPEALKKLRNLLVSESDEVK